MTAQYLTEGEISNSPAIKLGGADFRIPRLAFKQNRVVVGNLKKIMPLIATVQGMAGAAKVAITAGGEIDQSWFLNFPIDAETMDILAEVTYAAVTRAHPEMSRAQFDDLPIGVDELLMALPVIITQSFAFAKKPAGEGKPAAPAGEAPVPTGTLS